jgi:hypothetical protein
LKIILLQTGVHHYIPVFIITVLVEEASKEVVIEQGFKLELTCPYTQTLVKVRMFICMARLDGRERSKGG